MRTIDAGALLDGARFSAFHMRVLFWCALIIIFDGYDLVIYGVVLPAFLFPYVLPDLRALSQAAAASHPFTKSFVTRLTGVPEDKRQSLLTRAEEQVRTTVIPAPTCVLLPSQRPSIEKRAIRKLRASTTRSVPSAYEELRSRETEEQDGRLVPAPRQELAPPGGGRGANCFRSNALIRQNLSRKFPPPHCKTERSNLTLSVWLATLNEIACHRHAAQSSALRASSQ